MAEWHFITGEYPPGGGGVGDYTRLVALGLAACGDTVHVWCPPGESTGVEDERVVVHRELGRCAPADLRRVGAMLDRFAPPRRVVVQWVPQAFGARGTNVAFPLWLRRRARARGDRVGLMVHEAYVRFSGSSWRQSAGAVVQRVMVALAQAAAERVWVSIPAWADRLRPYSPRRHDYRWLPVPSSVPVHRDPVASREVVARLAPAGGRLVGHFGTYGHPTAAVLERLVPRLAERIGADDRVLLLGRGGAEFLREIQARHPGLGGRVVATGELGPAELSHHLRACALVVQPYPDGITTRRTSSMIGLAHGVPVVATAGYLTESLWRETGAVRLVPVGDVEALADAASALLDDPAAREELGRRAAELYDRRFDVRHTVGALREAMVDEARQPEGGK